MLEYRMSLYPQPHPVSNQTSIMIFLGQVYHVRWFSEVYKLCTHGGLGANQAKPVSHVEPVPHSDQKKVSIFFHKIEPDSLLV